MASQISKLFDTIAQNSSLISQNPELMDGHARQNVIAAATSLIHQLETPGETLARIGWGQPSLAAALRVAHDLGLFTKLNPNVPVTSAQMARGIAADPLLIGKLPRNRAV